MEHRWALGRCGWLKALERCGWSKQDGWHSASGAVRVARGHGEVRWHPFTAHAPCCNREFGLFQHAAVLTAQLCAKCTSEKAQHRRPVSSRSCLATAGAGSVSLYTGTTCHDRGRDQRVHLLRHRRRNPPLEDLGRGEALKLHPTSCLHASLLALWNVKCI